MTPITPEQAERLHRLKLDGKYFSAIHSGAKKAEFRKADRDYRVGDYLLMEHLLVQVTHILRHEDFAAIPEDYCILSFQYPVHPTSASSLPLWNRLTKRRQSA